MHVSIDFLGLLRVELGPTIQAFLSPPRPRWPHVAIFARDVRWTSSGPPASLSVPISRLADYFSHSSLPTITSLSAMAPCGASAPSLPET